ncbi:MAG: bifunctional hydroxymethylpyrimidine kinase/phosphomethylpyrimidine kinase [Planctomycetes bacterium]|nr:bifunctional hydroxymethylpyrimidine kinase/phosphomethylpyrimidine kinase [Planctomycetota bacterium]
MHRQTPRILAIAGSDSGGGAGIQADLKTITALGGFGMSAITALTAQNTSGVRGIHNVPPDFVRTQIEAVVEDIGVDVVKTGMLANAEIVNTVARCISEHPVPHLVVDPVMVAKSGDSLLAPEAEKALREELFPLASIITPNIPEAEALLGVTIETPQQMRETAENLRSLGPKWVLLKGGHLDGEPVDILCGATKSYEVVRARISTKNTHGTGCTYASAIASLLGMGFEMPRAVETARDAVQAAIEGGLRLGKGHGPVNHRAIFDQMETDKLFPETGEQESR